MGVGGVGRHGECDGSKVEGMRDEVGEKGSCAPPSMKHEEDPESVYDY